MPRITPGISKIRSCLGGFYRLSDEVLAHVAHLNTSAGIWSALECTFVSRSRAQVMQSRLDFHMLIKVSLSMFDYFLEAKTLGDRLAAAGHPVSDYELILYILSGL